MSDSKPYLSHSQINMFSNCGEQYRRRYIEGEKIPPGVAALRGRGVHGASEINFRQKIETGADLPKADLVDAAVTAFRETQYREGVWLTEEERGQGADVVVGKAIDSTVRLTGLYADNVAPAVDPALVETRIRIELPESPYDMLGVVDVATKDHRIKDLKTAAKSKTQSDADSSLQLTWYGLSYQAATGHEVASVDLEVLVDTKTPKHQRLATTRSRRDYEVLVQRVNATIRAIQAGVFPPANPGWWGCSPRFCGFFSSCRYANSERKDAANE